MQANPAAGSVPIAGSEERADTGARTADPAADRTTASCSGGNPSAGGALAREAVGTVRSVATTSSSTPATHSIARTGNGRRAGRASSSSVPIGRYDAGAARVDVSVDISGKIVLDSRRLSDTPSHTHSITR